jgi:hypothetical protein
LIETSTVGIGNFFESGEALFGETGKKNLGWNKYSSSSKTWVIDKGTADYINSARLRDQRLHFSLQEEIITRAVPNTST